MIYNEISKHGLFVLKFAWKRFEYIVEWEKFLILIPVNKKIDTFIIRKDEFGEENIEKFKSVSIPKLKYRRINNYHDLI